MSERTRRLDTLLREEISRIIREEIHDPRVGFVTITNVDVTRDLRHATVWASIIGTPEERKAAMAALGRAMPFVRHELGDLRLRRIPDLHLREDDTAEEATRVMRLIDQLEAGDGDISASVPEPGSEPGQLPTPTTLNAANDSDDAEPPLPAGYRRRVDRVAFRKARERRGR